MFIQVFKSLYEVPLISYTLGLFFFSYTPYNTICALGPHRERAGSLYPQKQEPHLGHTVLVY